MIPSWIVNTLVVIVGSIFAIYLGSSLPDYGWVGGYLLVVTIICLACIATNHFPLLMALALWIPITPPLPGLRIFPTIAVVFAWFGVVTFFRLCVTKRLDYVPSCNLFILLCFMWVPIRFLMNPVHKLGGFAGGEGISGANAYFTYVLAAVLVMAMGCVLNSRSKIFSFMRWSLVVVLIVGIILFICAFIPATGPFLAALGMFSAGYISDGIQRLVVLPGFGLFLVEAALCRNLFRLSRSQCIFIFLLGLAMMIVGGNRSAIAAVIIAIPVIFLLRRKTHALVISLALMGLFVALLHLTVKQMDPENIPPLMRSMGIFESKIDDATGGSNSAEWRYEVWQSGVEKIKESPLIGKGFGNLPMHMDVDRENSAKSTDFEVILAGGEAHNGFISAAYGFGIPFMLCLTLALIWRMVSLVKSALTTDVRDGELRDFYAFMSANFATYGILIYTALDMSTLTMWIYVGLGITMQHLARSSGGPAPVPIVSRESRSSEVNSHYAPAAQNS